MGTRLDIQSSPLVAHGHSKQPGSGFCSCLRVISALTLMPLKLPCPLVLLIIYDTGHLLQAKLENISRTSQVDVGCLRPGFQLHFHGYFMQIAQSQVLQWHREHYSTEFFSLFYLLNVQILEGRITPTKSWAGNLL